MVHFTSRLDAFPVGFQKFGVKWARYSIIVLGSAVLLSGLSFIFNPEFAHAEKVLRIALTAEPPNLDASKATDAESFAILAHVMEGLTRYDENNNLAPALAERWELNSHGARFYIRKNARWDDGKPVTARDFVFAWRRLVDPKTASEYAFIMYPVKNAEAINQGKLPVDQLGVVAKDDVTLDVTFETSCGYFLGLMAFSSFFPQREDFYKKVGERYAADADKMMYNGPFKLVEWIHGASLKLVKNEMYWNRDSIKLDRIEAPYITPDATSRFNLYKTKKIDFIPQLSKENLSNSQHEGFRIKKFLEGTLFYLQFNLRPGQKTANLNLRKAISLVIDRNQYVSRVVGIPGTGLGRGMVPSWMTGVSDKFRKEYPLDIVKANVPLAKEYLQKAMKEMGLNHPPQLTFLTTDSEAAIREGDYLQSLLKMTLDIDLHIDRQIFKQRLAKMKAGDFEIVSGGWGPDYADPLTFIDLWASWNGNNVGEWKNAQYDTLVKTAMNSSDPKVRMSSMAQAEKILLEDVGAIPTYERIILYTQPKRIKGVVRHPIGGDPDYTHADIME